MNTSIERTLLLAQGYEPIRVISWQRAITLLALDKVDVVEQYAAEVRAQTPIVREPAYRTGEIEHADGGAD